MRLTRLSIHCHTSTPACHAPRQGIRACVSHRCGQGSRAGSRHARRLVSASASRNYYERLGLESDADDEDIKAAFRRKALEMHPDVNKEPDAEQQFMDCKEAYETLSDSSRRQEYDRLNRLGRRVGFFQDIVEDDDYAARSAPFRWSRVGSEPDLGYASRRRNQADDGDGASFDEEDESEEEGQQRNGGGEHDDAEERLRQLLRFMEGQAGAGGTLRQWQRGSDPWGTSSSDMWHRQVDQQTRDPRFGRGPGFRSGGDGFPGGTEWTPPGRGFGEDDDLLRKRQGWSPPGRRDEWRPPGRSDPDDDEPRRGRGEPGRGPGRRGWGDDGGFRGKPL